MIYNNRLAKAKRRLKGAMIRSHTEKIKLVEVQGDPTNEGVRDILSDSQAKLAKVYQNQVSRNQHLSSGNWFRYGDTCSKNFFDFHKLGQKKTLLRELKTESSMVKGQSDLSHHRVLLQSLLLGSTSPGHSESPGSVLGEHPDEGHS